MTSFTAEYFIRHLRLEPHPEGGFYKETYRSAETFDRNGLPERFDGDRNFSTSIYFLLRSTDKSMLHRIKSDELWHYHAGSSLTIYMLNGNGLTTAVLGTDFVKGESLQVVVPAGAWFGAMVNEKQSFVLSGCTVAPGFDFRDFELAKRSSLVKLFPDHEQIIKTLTHAD